MKFDGLANAAKIGCTICRYGRWGTYPTDLFPRTPILPLTPKGSP